ncbi:hypothetical protein [Pleionea sediminis]|uniref:hypothetical protein n=1 Tax=Pleionea sediminis TaxID=2569479 RepID=UPI001FEC2008|nr:hypothetical protein [Pleionea sediminis]
MKQNNSKLEAKYVPLNKLSFKQVLGMYQVFVKYYENVEQEVFINDMSEKEGIIILTDNSIKKIVGFSTLKKVPLDINGKKGIGLFSGDTVLERQYWGDRSLHTKFLHYIVKLKISNPLTPVYWLLISKGYKTYLLMANNFVDYYPRADLSNSNSATIKNKQLKSVVSNYCEQLFPKAFDQQNMILDFGENSQHLKDNVAEITKEMQQKYPKIDFFVKRNPDWHRGTELPCVGEISFKLFASYIGKMLKRRKPVAPNKEVAANWR